jgi:hypothetical protein
MINVDLMTEINKGKITGLVVLISWTIALPFDWAWGKRVR